MTPDARAFVPAAIDRFTARVRAIPDEAWSAPTPCSAWSVRDLVNHMGQEHFWAPHVLLGETMEAVGDRFDGDVLGAAPVQSWERAAAASRAAFGRTGEHAERAYTIFGPIPIAEYAEQMLLDLTVHEWDLARGSGLDDTVDAACVERALAYLDSDPVMLTGPGLFAPTVPYDDDAPLARLLAAAGRRPRSSGCSADHGLGSAGSRAP